MLSLPLNSSGIKRPGSFDQLRMLSRLEFRERYNLLQATLQVEIHHLYFGRGIGSHYSG